MSIFYWQIRVYYEDTDAGGVVYHARYLNFFERARTEWLRALGLDQTELSQQQDILFAVRSMDIQFIKPARLDDQLIVTVEPVSLGGASMELEQRMQRLHDECPISSARVKVACLQAGTFTPTRIPKELRLLLSASRPS